MSNELAKKQMCLVMRNGIEVWLDEEKAKNVGAQLQSGAKGMMLVEGRYINSVDLIGIFPARDMDEQVRRRNGQWKCSKGTWHDRAEKCICSDPTEKELLQKKAEVYGKCGKCVKGLIEYRNTETGNIVMVPCECQLEFIK